MFIWIYPAGLSSSKLQVCTVEWSSHLHEPYYKISVLLCRCLTDFSLINYSDTCAYLSIISLFFAQIFLETRLKAMFFLMQNHPREFHGDFTEFLHFSYEHDSLFVFDVLGIILHLCKPRQRDHNVNVAARYPLWECSNRSNIAICEVNNEQRWFHF